MTLRLSAGDVRRLRRSRSPRGVLTSIEKGRKGPKTTIRNPRAAAALSNRSKRAKRLFSS